MKFSKDFKWGVATASFQIEGATKSDGRGDSVWDKGCRADGNVYNHDTGDIACDHYNRYKEDVKLLKELGVTAYRFSLSWTRIIPDGDGEVNQKGLDFYNNLIDELLKNGIEPCVTLFHWDYPTDLFRKGGWLNDDSSDWFAYYTKIVAEAFKGRVKTYMTINEPQCVVHLGHRVKNHAPHQTMDHEDCIKVVHNILKANGKAFRVIKSIDKTCKVAIAPCSVITIPQEKTKEAENFAYEQHFKSKGPMYFQNALFTDPVFLGKYPQDVLDDIKVDFKPSKEDMEIIKCDMDFIAINMYHGTQFTYDKTGKPTEVKSEPGAKQTAMGWPVEPEALYYGPKFLHRRYNKPIIVSENGLALTEWKTLDGKVEDPMRIDFMNRYLNELNRGYKDGVPVEGYFHWSFLDNFEWSLGYSKRFGIVYVDYTTLERTPKSSYYHYQNLIKQSK